MNQPRIKARLEIERMELIHNALSSAAFHLKCRVEKALSPEGDREGVGLDVMAGITMLAFTCEAYLNFVGNLKITDWDERASGKVKRKLIWKKLGLEWEPHTRPASTLLRLKKARDIMAHGKPVEVRKEWTAEGTHDELQKSLREYQSDFDELVTPEFFALAYEDVEAVWRLLLEAGDIKFHETLDHGGSGITFISMA